MNKRNAGLAALSLALGSLGGCAAIVGADFDGLHAKGAGGAVGAGGGGHGGANTTAAGGYGGTGVGGHGGHAGQGGGSCVPACSDPAEPDCETVFCDNGTCKSDPRALGIACANATKVCDGKGACVACNLDGDCKDIAKPSCVSKQCVPAGCKDGTKDGDETDVDCGGSCTGCDTDRGCAKNADCLSQACTALKCAAPTCSDGIKNGTESDVDCGGSCTGCGPSLKCGADGDCAGKQCDPGAHTCMPNCADGVKDNAETDVDCGGGVCGKCADGRGCTGAGDCASGTCAGAPLKCGGVIVPPSCAGGLDCGGISCCDAQAVPGGTFPMGRGNGTDAYAGGLANEQPEHNVTVADFRLDTFEITVGRFRKFVEQFDGTPPAPGAGAHPLIPNSGWQAAWNGSLAASQAAFLGSLKCDPADAAYATWTDGPGASESYAINCVTWFDVFAFCAWDGGRLPTEAEWEYAAVAGAENRLYPWGATDPSVTKTFANFSGSDDSPFIAVGSHATGNGKWGHRDMAGGMWEWAFDRYDASWYSGGGVACTNCANVSSGSTRVSRGGAWAFGAQDLRAAYRYGGDGPTARGPKVGARCARLPASCTDNLKDGTETDVDCGGAFCNRCADTKACLVASDCASGNCTGKQCGPPSCAGGLDCGGVSCCDAPLVPGGTFPMGRGNGTDAYAGGNANEQPEHNVTVAGFRLDAFEVTVGRFRKFVEQFNGTPPAPGAGAHPLIANSGWQVGWNGSLAASQGALIANLKCEPTYQTWTPTAAGGHEAYPINCVSWFEAFAFCAWDGGRLSTEAEWEYASAGGTDNRLYPWGGAAPDNTLTGFNCAFGGTPGTCTFADLAPVGTTPAGNGKWGHRDLAGGMWEWNLDWWDSAWYSGGGAACDNCANLNASAARVARGGAWNSIPLGVRTAFRNSGAPTLRDLSTGVRCARSAP